MPRQIHSCNTDGPGSCCCDLERGHDGPHECECEGSWWGEPPGPFRIVRARRALFVSLGAAITPAIEGTAHDVTPERRRLDA